MRLERGPGIVSLPDFAPIPDDVELPVILKAGDDVSTDEILPGGTRGMAYWSKVENMAEVAFDGVDPEYPERARATRDAGGHAVVGGRNYGQGSSREQAALAPRYLGLRVVIAKRFARMHWENLANFGVLPLVFADPGDYDRLRRDDRIALSGVHRALRSRRELRVAVAGGDQLTVRHDLSPRQVDLLLQGGLINWMRARLGSRQAAGARPR